MFLNQFFGIFTIMGQFIHYLVSKGAEFYSLHANKVLKLKKLRLDLFMGIYTKIYSKSDLIFFLNKHDYLSYLYALLLFISQFIA